MKVCMSQTGWLKGAQSLNTACGINVAALSLTLVLPVLTGHEYRRPSAGFFSLYGRGVEN